MTAGLATIPQTSTLPVFDTHVPFVGVVDLSQKMEWLYWGGIAATVLLVKSGAKWLIVAGILALRYELNKGTA